VEKVFGLPAGPLALTLEVLVVLALGIVTVLALRNLVFLKMGLRNIPRRRARSALIVLGLMLGTTIIASALLTGDTMASAVRSSAIEMLGATDETVTAGTDVDVNGAVGFEAPKPYFDAAAAVAAIDAATASAPVDGVMAAIIEPVAAQHAAAGQTEPRVTLFAPDAARAAQFGFEGVDGLSPNDVLLDEQAADDLAAGPGDDLVLLAGDRLLAVRVAGIGQFDGTGSDVGAVILPLDSAQGLLGHAGGANHVLVSNDGDATTGVELTETVEPVLDHAVVAMGLDAQPAKRDALDFADETGNAFVQLFTTFGSFSMAAGILLIFLIFVLLAGERRAEMGMARAVGTQRRHLVLTFLFEGTAYDVVAAAVGALLGIVVSYLMVLAVAAAFTGEELDLTYSLSTQSLVIAYGIGVLLTLVVVTASAWRGSRLNIVSAIRELPEPVEREQHKRRWLGVALGCAIGVAMASSGASGQNYLSWTLGVSIVVLSLVPVARVVTHSDRFAYTAAGAFLLMFWLLPLSTFDSLFGDMSMDFSVWIVGGLIIVVAATWLVTYNADILLGVVSRLTAPFASLRPVMRMAVAYPLRNRFRTGVTMAMFMLVVFTLVTGTTIPQAFTNAFDDVESYGGGFDVRASTAPAAAVSDLRDDLPADVAVDIVADGAQSFVPVEARQTDADRPLARYALRGLDDNFLERTTYGFAATGTGYESADEVWAALEGNPSLAVVDAFVAPRRQQWGFAPTQEFVLSGFYVDEGTFEPVPVTVHDALSGTDIQLTVIGVLSDNAPFTMSGITVSQDALSPFGDRAVPTLHHLALRPGADATAVAAAVEASLLARGVEAESYADILDEAVAGNMLFIRLVQGFMGLGLVVGVAALGVISARSVVERRQQLGMLRAIGFQPEMIRRVLLAESSVVTFTAIVVGCVTGLVLSYNVIADAQAQPGWSNVEFAVPWLNLVVVFTAVIVAAMLTTLASAHRATHIYPAEALRYQ
jgi:putative ABC transport system permease protein